VKIDEALELADLWSDDILITANMGGWRVACKTLADEVRRLRAEAETLHRRAKSYPAHSCDIPGCAVCDPTYGL
jgi:hypothetical protein